MKALAAALVLALSAALPAFAGPCTPSDIVVKFATVVSATDNPKGIAAQIFADRVNREMAGKVCVIVYPDSTLYDDDTVLQAMLQGDVQLAAPSLSKFEAFTKVFRLFDLPFLFTNLAAVSAFEASPAGAKMKNAMLSRGLTGLEFWHSGMKQFSANRPLVWPADAKGLKFRIQPSDVIAAEIRALGAQPPGQRRVARQVDPLLDADHGGQRHVEDLLGAAVLAAGQHPGSAAVLAPGHLEPLDPGHAGQPELVRHPHRHPRPGTERGSGARGPGRLARHGIRARARRVRLQGRARAAAHLAPRGASRAAPRAPRQRR